jgi:hypothetical protein
MKPNTKQPAEPSLAEMAASAKTASEHYRVKTRLERMLFAAKEELKELEAGRKQAAIEESTDALADRMQKVREKIVGLDQAIDEREKLRDAAETAEMIADMEAGARKAHEMAPEGEALLKEAYDHLIAIIDVCVRSDAKRAEIDGHQAHALRANRRDLTMTWARIRGDAAAKFPRPVLDASHASPMSMRDNLAVAAVLAVEAINQHFVHDDAFDARRNLMVVSADPRKAADGVTILDPTGTQGRAFGGLR